MENEKGKIIVTLKLVVPRGIEDGTTLSIVENEI